MPTQMLGSAFIVLAFALSLSAKEPHRESRISLASASPQLQPVASLVLSESPSSGQVEAALTSVAFTSESSIAVGVCLRDFINQKCSLVLVRWEGETLQPFAQTPRFDAGVSVHPASDGRILAVRGSSPTVVYSADLSTVHDLRTRSPSATYPGCCSAASRAWRRSRKRSATLSRWRRSTRVLPKCRLATSPSEPLQKPRKLLKNPGTIRPR